MKRTAGFSLVQLLMVVAIIGLIGVGAFQAYSNWYASQATVLAAQQIARDLDSWRLKAKLENNRYDLSFSNATAGSSTYAYAKRSTSTPSTFSTSLKTVALPSNVKVRVTSGMTTFSFKPPYGSVEPNSTTTFTPTQLTVTYGSNRFTRTVNLVSVLGRVVIK